MHFELTSPEGLPIRGNLDAPEKPVALVVAVHGFKGFKDWGFFPWLAERLVGHGFAVCRFNMSRSGIGDDPETFERLDLFEHDTWSVQLADLRLVVAWATERVPSVPVFLLGHSRGGGVVLLGAEGVPRLRGVVVWAPVSHVDRWDAETLRQFDERGFTEVVNARTQQTMRVSRAMFDDWTGNRERLDILAAASRLDVPLLVVHGARDESVPVGEGRALAAAAPDAATGVIVPAGHTFNAIHPLVTIPPELSLAAEMTAHFVAVWARKHVRDQRPVE